MHSMPNELADKCIAQNRELAKAEIAKLAQIEGALAAEK
jgi:hypothetical protein